MQWTLNGEWKLSFTNPDDAQWTTLAATVPGNVEIELEKNGLIGDTMPADDIYATSKLDSVDDWTYTRTFDAPTFEDGWTQELVFEGIDTIAEISLNGEKIYDAQDMFVAHRIDVRGKLKAEGNELKVVIRSAFLWAQRHPRGDIFGISRTGDFYGGQPYLRKARHEWGWDNAPRLLTSGIYRSVYIESLPPECFDEVYLYTMKVEEDRARVGIIWNYQTRRKSWVGYRLHIQLSYKGSVVYESCERVKYVRGMNRFYVPLDKIGLWWPRGFGEANLCDLKLEMLYDDEVEGAYESKWGIRTLRLERTEDILDDNTGDFVFIVNNERIFINGSNWKPLDAYHSLADAKVEKVLDLANDLNCNMVRIWGGGIYEDHPFFDYCDAHGIMVWQDFMFGCEFPPCDEEYCKIVEEETRQIIEKLRNHPSLAVWCGDNEDDECLTWNHGDSTILPSDNKITRKVLKECVLRYDPYRSYVESSPYASDENIKERRAGGPITHHQPEAHLYPATMHFAQALRDCKGRFVGETGPITVNAMTDNPRIFAREEARARRLWDVPLERSKYTNDGHQLDNYFMSWRQCGKELCEAWFGRDFTVDEWKDYCVAINVICGDVFKDVIEFSRTDRWNKTGVLWWSLYDMWPMMFNYSVVDVDFRKKMPYYWIKQSQQEFALMVIRKEVGGEVALYSANDTLKGHKGTYRITAVSAKGEEREIAMGSYDEVPNGSRLLQRMPENGQELWIIRWVEDGKEYVNHFVTGHRPYDFEAWKLWTNILNELYGAEKVED